MMQRRLLSLSGRRKFTTSCVSFSKQHSVENGRRIIVVGDSYQGSFLSVLFEKYFSSVSNFFLTLRIIILFASTQCDQREKRR